MGIGAVQEVEKSDTKRTGFAEKYDSLLVSELAEYHAGQKVYFMISILFINAMLFRHREGIAVKHPTSSLHPATNTLFSTRSKLSHSF